MKNKKKTLSTKRRIPDLYKIERISKMHTIEYGIYNTKTHSNICYTKSMEYAIKVSKMLNAYNRIYKK